MIFDEQETPVSAIAGGVANISITMSSKSRAGTVSTYEISAGFIHMEINLLAYLVYILWVGRINAL